MPLDQDVLDEILNLTAQQMLTELRTAASEGKAMDPRKVKNALDLVERADARAFKPKEPEVISKTTGEVVEVPPDQPLWKTKKGRDMLRKMFLKDAERALLARFDEEDGSKTPSSNASRASTDGKDAAK